MKWAQNVQWFGQSLVLHFFAVGWKLTFSSPVKNGKLWNWIVYHIVGLDLMLQRFQDWYNEFQHIKITHWVVNWERKVWCYVKILQLGSKKQEYVEFPPEMKRDLDPSQDIHSSPFPVLLILTSPQRWGQYGPNDELMMSSGHWALRSYYCK